MCLARFDELKHLGLDKFTRKYDPYWDIPLNENLPQPVIDLPLPAEATDDGPRTHGRKRRRVPADGDAQGETRKEEAMNKWLRYGRMTLNRVGTRTNQRR